MENEVFGRVKWFRGDKGFGFVTGDDGQEVFLHISQLKKCGIKDLAEGERLSYTIADTPKGPQARDIKKVG